MIFAARCFPQSDDFLGLIQPTLSTEEVTISLNGIASCSSFVFRCCYVLFEIFVLDVNLDSQAFDVLVNCIRAVGSPLGKIKLKGKKSCVNIELDLYQLIFRH